MQQYMYELAKIAVQSAETKGLYNIDPRWIYSQWCHESNNFSSELFIENKNSGGLTQTEPNGDENMQPDGNYWYKIFDTYEEYADFFGRYLRYFKDSNIQEATTMEEYIIALKNSPSGAYFGDDLDNYVINCYMRYNQAVSDGLFEA